MLKFQIILLIVLISCITFVSCNRMQDPLETVIDTGDTLDTTTHKSWMNVMLPSPPTEVTMPSESGSAHGAGSRTVYFNEAAATANMEGTTYPAGAMIVKEIMDDADMFVQKIAKMTKTDDPMYAEHGGWMYVKYARADEMSEYMMVGGGSVAQSAGCDGCHAKADNDYVFVSLSSTDSEGDGTDLEGPGAGDDATGMNGENTGMENGDDSENSDPTGNGGA